MIEKIAPDYTHKDLTEEIIGIFYAVYNELGYGFLESVYRGSLFLALKQVGLDVQKEVPIAVYSRGHKVGDFKADLLVNGVVLLELKAAKAIDPSFEAQLLNYLRATNIEIGLLLNFGPRAYFRRVAYSNSRKQICVDLRDLRLKIVRVNPRLKLKELHENRLRLGLTRIQIRRAAEDRRRAPRP
jgi:GxxExxY protein